MAEVGRKLAFEHVRREYIAAEQLVPHGVVLHAVCARAVVCKAEAAVSVVGAAAPVGGYLARGGLIFFLKLGVAEHAVYHRQPFKPAYRLPSLS